jgi:hypothetical protein
MLRSNVNRNRELTIVARSPHLWRIFVASILAAPVMVNQSCDGFGPYQLLFWMPEQFLPYPSRLQTPWLDATDGAWRQTRASKLPRIETEPVPDKYFLSDRQIKWEEISQPLSDAPWKGWNARRPSAICGSHPKDQMKIAGTLNLVKGIASLPATCAACHRGQLGDDRRPFVRPPRSRFKLTPQSCKLPVEAVERCRVCCRRCPSPRLFAPPPLPWSLRRRPGAKLGSNVAYLSGRGFLRTHALPLVWFQIARSGAFYFAFPHPAARPKFDQYAPKTSSKGSTSLGTARNLAFVCGIGFGIGSDVQNKESEHRRCRGDHRGFRPCAFPKRLLSR